MSEAGEEGEQRVAPAQCRIPQHRDRPFGDRPARDGVAQQRRPWQQGEAAVSRAVCDAGAGAPRPRDTRAQWSPLEQEPWSR